MARDETDKTPQSSFDQFPQLLAEAKAGSQLAIAELLDACRNYLLLIANQELDRDLQNKFGPSDIVQNTMIAINQHVADFEGDQSDQFFAWVRQILINDLNRARREFKQTSKRNISRERSVAGDGGLRQLPVDVPSPDFTPQTTAARREEKQLLERALASLPDEYRIVIRLRNEEQLPFEKIGMHLGRSADASQKLWTRAIEKLKVELKKLDAI